MPLFRIVETAAYEIEAEDAEAALEAFTQAEDVNEFFQGVESRDVQEIR
jgi:hypothetical protein